jgi:hypothetical protein
VITPDTDTADHEEHLRQSVMCTPIVVEKRTLTGEEILRLQREALANAASGLGDFRPIPESLEAQVKRLADVIMHEVPGEPSQNEGAIDCAIRLLRTHVASKALKVGDRVWCLDGDGPFVVAQLRRITLKDTDDHRFKSDGEVDVAQVLEFDGTAPDWSYDGVGTWDGGWIQRVLLTKAKPEEEEDPAPVTVLAGDVEKPAIEPFSVAEEAAFAILASLAANGRLLVYAFAAAAVVFAASALGVAYLQRGG